MINELFNVTSNHRIYVNHEWTYAGEIKTGDYLLDINGKEVIVESIKYFDSKEKVYNIETSHETHNYFVSDILVHNTKMI